MQNDFNYFRHALFAFITTIARDKETIANNGGERADERPAWSSSTPNEKCAKFVFVPLWNLWQSPTFWNKHGKLRSEGHVTPLKVLQTRKLLLNEFFHLIFSAQIIVFDMKHVFSTHFIMVVIFSSPLRCVTKTLLSLYSTVQPMGLGLELRPKLELELQLELGRVRERARTGAWKIWGWKSLGLKLGLGRFGFALEVGLQLGLELGVKVGLELRNTVIVLVTKIFQSACLSGKTDCSFAYLSSEENKL